MPSSTSSSEPVPSPARPGRMPLLDRRVWLGLLALFVLLEIFTRTRLFAMSKDFRRFRTYPERAQALTESTGAVRLAFMGNSATDRGVDPRVVETALGARGVTARADLFVADQSRIDTWRFMFERYFAAPGRRPDLVAVTFYENDLEDGNVVEIGRLAQFFTTVKDWPEVFAGSVHGLDDRASFVIASGWATYAASDRIRERVMEALVPGFREHSERVNQIIFRHESARAAPAAAAPHAPSFQVLGRLLARASERGIPLVFVAYPSLLNQGELQEGQMPYELPPELLATLRAGGARLLDLRRVPGLRREHYADEVHLTEAGKPLYSQAFGAALATVLPGK
jgi:hypothetical protein